MAAGVDGCLNQAYKVVGGAAVSTAAAYLGARWVTTINPMNGALFGLVFSLVNDAVEPFFKAILGVGAGEQLECLADVVRCVVNIGITVSICAALGVYLTLQSACLLFISAFAIVFLVVTALSFCAVCLGVMA